ncbi:MAG: hypothetical protein O2931_10690 [Planctomycetota bacterium]|nr:hypothetical protein [Planctomycetota bacterium]
MQDSLHWLLEPIVVGRVSRPVLEKTSHPAEWKTFTPRAFNACLIGQRLALGANRGKTGLETRPTLRGYVAWTGNLLATIMVNLQAYMYPTKWDSDASPIGAKPNSPTP